ncbi:MAG: cytochrome P450 [Gemmatimonadaceae bacterium]|nr:cytochrome P450 [Gemmatimonadaceae bacterium]
MTGVAYRPPAPSLRSPLVALLRTIARRDRDLLSILPVDAYRELITPLGSSRRGILLVNDPAEVTKVLADVDGLFPKNDLMVGALAPLVGESIFVSNGARWRRQRQMIDPAFSHMRINRAFAPMAAAVDDFIPMLARHADDGTALSLDQAMSHVTADIITRTIFSTSLESEAARGVFTAFARWQARVANVEILKLLLEKPFADIPQPPAVVDACTRIREHIGALIDERLAPGATPIDDIAGAAILARDADGIAMTREELIDEIGTFFLAGHETTASVLTWVFFVLSQQPALAERMREELEGVVGRGEVQFEHLRRLPFVRNVFRETMRLYPPITFIPRVATADTTIGGRRVKRGTMVMISPWTMHRHIKLWPDPDRFDPDRFAPERERGHVAGAYIPFGTGPRVCVGAAFAQTESALILARVVRDYDFEVLDPASVRPVSRLTTRPARDIMCRVRRRA